MKWPIPHLTADDLDAFHSASLLPEASRHLSECAECRALVERDRALVSMLESLPDLAPSAGFAERVMARVAAPAPVAAAPRIGVAARRAPRFALAASLAILAGASIVWSLFNWSLLRSWIDRGAVAARELVWDTVATVAQNISEQPWIVSVQSGSLAGGRLLLLGGVLLCGYAVAMIALRRLLVSASPTRPAW